MNVIHNSETYGLMYDLALLRLTWSSGRMRTTASRSKRRRTLRTRFLDGVVFLRPRDPGIITAIAWDFSVPRRAHKRLLRVSRSTFAGRDRLWTCRYAFVALLDKVVVATDSNFNTRASGCSSVVVVRTIRSPRLYMYTTPHARQDRRTRLRHSSQRPAYGGCTIATIIE